MRAVVALAALVACGSPRTPRPTPGRPGRDPVDDAWRPDLGGLEPLPKDLEVLDLDPEAVDWRWPLPGPPALIPSGDLAGMFASRDGWTSLCAARRDPKGVDRDEALAYLRAWCDLPPDLALAKSLAPLTVAKTPAIAAAATFDLAAVLESKLGATEALEWLRYNGAKEGWVLDALAATYLATDRLDDTRTVIRALRGFRAWGALQCRRAFREMFVTDRSRRDQIRAELFAASNDAVCSRLSGHASCTLSWGIQARGEGAPAARLDLERCTPILLENPQLSPHAYLTIAAAHWPIKSRSFDVWLELATFATGAIGAPRAEELISAAFTNAVRLSDCDGQLDQVRAAVATLGIERVRKLGNTTRAECERRQGTPPR